MKKRHSLVSGTQNLDVPFLFCMEGSWFNIPFETMLVKFISADVLVTKSSLIINEFKFCEEKSHKDFQKSDIVNLLIC